MPTIVSGDLVRRIQSSMGDPSKTFITDLDCYDWIMDAQHEISKITECLTSTFTINSVANQEYYTPDTTILKVLRATYNSYKLGNTTLQTLDRIDPDRDVTGNNGVPTHYFLDGNQLGLWPKPSTSVTGALKVRARILCSQTIAASNIVLELPDYMRENIFKYCMLKAREKDEQPEIWQLMLQEWKYNLGVATDIANNPEGASYPSVSDVDRDLDSYVREYMI
jgi:hypothetical protein